jgi:hypothetical protein
MRIIGLYIILLRRTSVKDDYKVHMEENVFYSVLTV